MKILINAVNLKVGGGVTVIFNFLSTIIQNREFHRHTYHVIAPSGVGYEKYNAYPIHIEIMPEAMKSALNRICLDYTWLKNRVNKIDPGIVFTMGNMAIPTNNKKQGVLFMYPYAIYPKDYTVWKILNLPTRINYRLRNLLFKQRLKYADIVFPQTHTSEQRLHKYYGSYIKKTKVIPTAFSEIGQFNEVKSFYTKNKKYKYLLTLTKYYRHKNLEILIKVGLLIKEKKCNFKLITTIGRDQGSEANAFLESVVREELEDVILNLGAIPYEEVPALYKQVDGLLLPTLLESYSATYADSLALGVPIFTSDRDFAKDVCGDCANYFDPLDEFNILEVITDGFNNSYRLKDKIIKGKDRANSFPSWLQVTQSFIRELELLNESY